MSGIIEAKTDQYLLSLLPARDPVMHEMENYAHRHGVPIVGPACGRMLYQLTRLVKARRVFELGSAIGYSTLWLARAVGRGGTVFYTDSDPANARHAEVYLRRAGVLDRVRVKVGNALPLLDSSRGKFDLIFNDVSKTQYPEVLRLAIPRLRIGGLLITDNVLWSGRVANSAKRNDADTRAIQEFNRLIYASPRLFTTVIPLRDGLAVCQRIK